MDVGNVHNFDKLNCILILAYDNVDLLRIPIEFCERDKVFVSKVEEDFEGRSVSLVEELERQWLVFIEIAGLRNRLN